MRANLLKADKPQTVSGLMNDSQALALGLIEAKASERCRLNGEAFCARADEHAGTTEEATAALDQRLRELALRPTPEIRDGLKFVDVLVDFYTGVYGEPPPEPVAGNFPYTAGRLLPEAVGAACLDLGISRLVLAAVAARRAVRTRPDMYKRGCADIQEHARRIAEQERKLRETLEHAANSWTRADISYRNGVATFNLSDGRVHVGSGEGDVEAMRRLLDYLMAQRP